MEHILLYGNPGARQNHPGSYYRPGDERQHQSHLRPDIRAGGRPRRHFIQPAKKARFYLLMKFTGSTKPLRKCSTPRWKIICWILLSARVRRPNPSACPWRVFTLIGATTKMSLLSGPLRDRFGHTFHLNFYETKEIEQILNRNAKILEVKLQPEATTVIAERSRRTPRLANRLFKTRPRFCRSGRSHRG